MASRSIGWAAFRDGMGPGWLAVAGLCVFGFWTVHEPGASWTTMGAGRVAGFLLLCAFSTLLCADWVARYAVEADAIWLRQTLAYGWVVPLLLAVPSALFRSLLAPGPSVAVAATHLWWAAVATTTAGLFWFHAAPTKDDHKRFYLAVAATAGVLAVWGVQAGIMGWLSDVSAPLVAWPVAFTLLGGLAVASRLADAGTPRPRPTVADKAKDPARKGTDVEAAVDAKLATILDSGTDKSPGAESRRKRAAAQDKH